MSAVLAKPQVKDFLKTLAKGKEKGQEQRKEHDVNGHAATAEGEPSKKPWEEDIPELSSPSYSPPTSFSYSSDSSSSSNPRRQAPLLVKEDTLKKQHMEAPDIDNAFLLFFDGSYRKSHNEASGGVVIYDPQGNLVTKRGLKLTAQSNNEAEYATLEKGLQLCLELGIQRVKVKGDALLVVKQVLGVWQSSLSVEAAINWVVEHENDPDIDEIPKVPAVQNIPQHHYTPEEAKAKMLELRERARKKKEEEDKRTEKEREKERIRVGKELLEAKRIEEENERKRLILLRKAEKEEEQRARDKIRQKLEDDKAERRRKLGLPPEETPKVQPSSPAVEVKRSFLPVRPASKAEQMRECLRGLKQNHKDDDARVKKAFQTLLTYVGNIVRSPDEEKYRKIRISNPTFQERVGSLKGGVQFLEICGFQKDSDDFLFLPRDKVDGSVLNTAGSELNSAIVNPFFGVL
ncbi:hypothetical protein L7F22_038086 [Adiantum nelumboides]|nr:hypothetical protein [Adiantum nelumboides]